MSADLKYLLGEWWTCNEVSAADHLVGAHIGLNLIQAGDPGVVTGGRSFVPNDRAVSSSQIFNLGTGDGTLAMRFRLTAMPPSGSRFLWGKGGSGNTSALAPGYCCEVNANGRPSLNFGQDTDSARLIGAGTNGDLVVDQDCLLIFEFDRDGAMRMLKNNVQIISADMSGRQGASNPVAPFCIGSRSPNTGAINDYISANYYWLAWWQRVLTDEEKAFLLVGETAYPSGEPVEVEAQPRSSIVIPSRGIVRVAQTAELPPPTNGVKLTEWNLGGDGQKSRVRTGDSSSPIAKNGATVAGWVEDVSGNGRHLTLVDGPGGVIAHPRIVGGRRVLNINTNTRYDNTSSIATSTLFVAAVVITPEAWMATNSTLLNCDTRMHMLLRRGVNFNPWGAWQAAPTYSLTSTGLALGTPYCLFWQFESGCPVRMWRNGVLEAVGGVHTFTDLPLGFSLARGNSTNERGRFQLLYLACWNGVARRDQVEDYARALMQAAGVASEPHYRSHNILGGIESFEHGQGYAADDAGNHYAFNNSAIYKFDSSLNQIASVDPRAVGQNHCGDGCWHGGLVYGVTENFSGSTGSAKRIQWHRDSDLALVGSTSNLTEPSEVSSICVGPNETLCVSDWNNSSVFYMYDLATKAFSGTVATGIANGIEGIFYRPPYFYFTRSQFENFSGGAAVYRMHKDAPGRAEFLFSLQNDYSGFAKIQGIDYSQNEMRLLTVSDQRDLTFVEVP